MSATRRDAPAWLLRIFVVGLRLYPAEFRERFGAEMSEVFRQGCRDAPARGGLARFALRALLDGLVCGTRMRCTAAGGEMAIVIVAALLGLFAGFMDFRCAELPITLGLVLLGAFLCGAVHPERAWLWALIVALAVPAYYLAATALGQAPVEGPPQPGLWIELLAVVPALVGAYAGVTLRAVPRLLGLGFALAFALGAAARAQAQAPSEAPAAPATGAEAEGAVAALVKEVMAATHAPAIAVAVVRDGELEHAAAFGTANVEADTPATTETPFALLSVGKLFTAVAVLQLARDGKLALTDTIGQRVPDLPEAWRDVTLRQLLSHTSGVPDYVERSGYMADVGRREAPRDVLRHVADRPPGFSPGARFAYSNSGFFLLGLLIESVSGESCGAYLDHHVFAPAGMPTARLDDGAVIVPQRASGYVFREGALQNDVHVDPSQTWAAGACLASVKDVARFEIALVAGKLLPADDVRAMEAPQPLPEGAFAPYGLGNEVGTDHGHRFAGHQGGGLGFDTTVLRFPDDHLCVIVLMNLRGSSSRDLARRIAALWLPDLGKADAVVEDKDPEFTRRFVLLLHSLARGEADADLFTPAAQAAILPGLCRMAPHLMAEDGALQSVELIGRDEEGAAVRLRYRARFDKENVVFTLLLDPQHRIAALQPQPE